MTPEERQLLIQTHRMVEENNALLRKMRRAALFGRIWHIFYWLVIIGLSVGAYYFIEPYVEQVRQVYGGFQSDVDTVKGAAGKLGELGSFFNKSGP